ncbi:MAG: lysozyme inhibitor LprI family protein [Pseudotabrizicola sp.]|uniref:lysozyme inhibitor LprI family protein n=1 Tax=Pseudotabrizicola sp. TaxID=2939647 RepID=UPI002717B670|nr:lysozyme inhibitor LprI family protein [Pseudotabrizicola sp.]MDO8883437.1 lysozyme inhibitor LprI family protein [Pseudotabrizicola sp.]MDP2079802.1 lysozyme inhibitor LprI family protein [Pseudotabrizicola sp.]MDZ7574803.1 lysozyme inhibitor LprI family protein [Pseudotabrizicola sp.]
MRVLVLSVIASVAGFASVGQAQSLDCNNAMTQRDMNACAALEFEAADKDLNAAYGQARNAMRRMDAELMASQRGAEVALRDAQRAWITFRDNSCTAEGFQMRGGSAEPLLVLGCKARLTVVRAADLWTLAAGVEG